MAEEHSPGVSVMKPDQQALWQQLQTQGLVVGDRPPDIALETPWYVRALTGFSGWLAAFFLLGFLSAGFQVVFDHPRVAITLGVGMIILAYKMLTAGVLNDFKHQFALAISFAGQALIAYGLFSLVDDLMFIKWLVVAVAQFALAWHMPSSLHRVWSAFAGSLAFCVALVYGHVYFIQTSLLMAAVCFIWIHELDWLALHDKIKPIAYGLTLALIYQSSGGQFYEVMMDVMLYNNAGKELWDSPWMGELLSGLVMLALVWRLLKQSSPAVDKKSLLVAMSGVLLLILASLEAKGITVGVMVMLLGYANGNRILTGLGTAALLFYLSAYYYMLDITLLEKSKLLALVGILLIAARFVLQHYLFKDRAVRHAE